VAALAVTAVCWGDGAVLSASDSAVLPYWDKINDGYYASAPAVITGALSELAAQKARIDAGTFAYVRAYALYRLATTARQKEEAMPRLLEADQLLSTPLPGVPEVEIYALRSAIDGLLAGAGDMTQSIQYGMACQDEAAHALRLAPANPRALISLAQTKGNTPPEYGGDRREAIDRLKQATASYSGQRGPGIYQWGEADAYTWLGIFCLKEKDRVQAKAAFEAALKVRPDFTWVKTVLLPKAERVANHS